MITYSRPALIASEVHKNAHALETKSDLPHGAVLADVLKTIEMELQKRGILERSLSESFHPVWFLAETERNVFLWRKGCSLNQQEDYEFWVDIPALIKKRLGQIKNWDESNPFFNPLWGVATPDKASAQKEAQYLESFLEVLKQVEVHAHALSKVASLVAKEFAEKEIRETVVLPGN